MTKLYETFEDYSLISVDRMEADMEVQPSVWHLWVLHFGDILCDTTQQTQSGLTETDLCSQTAMPPCSCIVCCI